MIFNDITETASDAWLSLNQADDRAVSNSSNSVSMSNTSTNKTPLDLNTPALKPKSSTLAPDHVTAATPTTHSPETEHPVLALLRHLHPTINWDATPEPLPTRSPKTDLTRHASLSMVKNARNGYLFARDHLGQPLNTFLTINFNRNKQHWEKGRSSAAKTSYVRDKLLRALRDWCGYHEVPTLWVYCIENPVKGGHGPHMHLLMHLPPDRWESLTASMHTFLATTMAWTKDDLQKVQDKIDREAPSLEERLNCSELWLPFYISPATDGEWRPFSEKEARIKLAYICKSIDPDAIVEIDGRTQTIWQHASSGITLKECGDPKVRKRIATGEPLSIGSRKAAGWVEDDDWDWLSRDVQDRRWRERVLTEHALRFGENTPETSIANNDVPEPVTACAIDLEKMLRDAIARSHAQNEELRPFIRELGQALMAS